MTSEATRARTEDFLRAHSFFGLPPDSVRLFDQTSLPVLQLHTGRMLMASRCSVATAPDGNGAVFEALQASGSLRDMESRGVGVSRRSNSRDGCDC